jgi:hypothetical protein
MAESNGLLDLMKSPAAMGLLAAGFGGLAGANRNTPINNIGRAGLAGLAGYSAADALQQKQRDQDKAAAIQAAIPTLYGQDGTFDYRKAAELGASPSDIKAYAELPSLGSPQAWKTLEVDDGKGGKKIITLDKQNRQLGDGFNGYVAPQLVDTGDTKQFVVPTAGQTFEVGISPYQQQSLAVRNQNNQILTEANEIQKTAQRTHVQVMPDGSVKLIDKGTGDFIEPKSPTGQPMPKIPQNLTEGEGKASIYLSQMKDASRTLSELPDVSPVKVGATGSTWTNWMAPAEAQQAAQAQRQWAESFLRAKTGAAATQQEVDGNIRTFFPVVGDTPEVIKSKADARAQAEQDMTLPAGRGADRIKPAGPSGNLTNSSNPPAAMPQFDADMEAEYQAWKAKQGGAQ